MNQEIKNLIVENRKKDRPLSEKSITAYVSTLSNLYKKIFEDEAFDISKFNNYIDIIGFLNDVPYNKRKSILAALLTVATDKTAYDKYRKAMMEDAREYDKEMEQNVMTEKYEDSWITGDEIGERGEPLKRKWEEIINTPDKTPTEKQDLQQYLLYVLTSGKKNILPRRLLDWTEMKVEKHDARAKIKPDYNIYDPTKKQFYFYRYKTDKSFNRQIIKPPLEVKKLLALWIKNKPESPYLFTDRNNSKLSPITLNQRLNKIYGDHRSINAIRHSYITEKYTGEEMPSIKELKENATKMAHSGLTHLKYIKRKKIN
jgi:hypothetical protein